MCLQPAPCDVSTGEANARQHDSLPSSALHCQSISSLLWHMHQQALANASTFVKQLITLLKAP